MVGRGAGGDDLLSLTLIAIGSFFVRRASLVLAFIVGCVSHTVSAGVMSEGIIRGDVGWRFDFHQILVPAVAG